MLGVYQQTNDVITRTSTLSYDPDQGTASWSAPIELVQPFPQRPRLGLHASGRPMVVWQGTNASGGSDVLLSVCR